MAPFVASPSLPPQVQRLPLRRELAELAVQRAMPADVRARIGADRLLQPIGAVETLEREQQPGIVLFLKLESVSIDERIRAPAVMPSAITSTS